MNPKWDCGSAFYYSRLTDINYEKVKSKLKAKLKEENPPKVTISTDGWTQHHDAFLGINGHYIDKNWILKKKINLACSVFNTEHTGINIWKQIDEVLVDWDLLSKVFEALRDNARNKVKSIEEGKLIVLDASFIAYVW